MSAFFGIAVAVEPVAVCQNAIADSSDEFVAGEHDGVDGHW